MRRGEGLRFEVRFLYVVRVSVSVAWSQRNIVEELESSVTRMFLCDIYLYIRMNILLLLKNILMS